MSTMMRTSRPLAAVAALRTCPFDLVTRAELAIQGCICLTNAALDGQPYAYAELHTDPPVALHSPWDYFDTAGGLLESLTLARIMNGTAPDDCDAAYDRLMRTHQTEEGLLALPATPWTHTAPIYEMEWSPRAALLAWTTRYLALDDADAQMHAQKLVHALSHRAIWDNEVCWSPAPYMSTKGWTDTQPPVGKMLEYLSGAQVIFPLVRFAEATGNEEAARLAHGLIRFQRERSGAFDKDGKLNARSARSFFSNTNFILGVLKHALLTGNDDDLQWARAAYDHARTYGTDFGFFPHRIAGEGRWQGSPCGVGTMIECALLLGMHADPIYLDDAERFGRNHLLESQILDLAWVERDVDAVFCQDIWCVNHPPEGVTTDEVCQRILGAFSGWTLPNDAFDPSSPRLMQRGTACGVRALYALWHYAVTRQEGAVQVNLHLSRDKRYATVTSLLPQEGGVNVLMKTRGVLAVRVPEGLRAEEILTTVNGQPRQETLRGKFVWLEALQNGDTVTVRWPLTEQATLYEIGGREYTGTWRGDTMLHIDPPGALAPLYRRPLEPQNAPALGAAGPVKEIPTL